MSSLNKLPDEDWLRTFAGDKESSSVSIESPLSQSFPTTTSSSSLPPPTREEEGFLELYLRYATEITDAPELFHRYAALAISAGAIGNRVCYRFGDLLLRPNLWICLIAPSSVGRKTTSLNIGKRIFNGVMPGRVMPEEFSAESLIQSMAASPESMFFASEFVALVSCIKKGYNEGLMGTLADLYDSPPMYSRQLRSGHYEIANAAPNILAATTVEWFLEKLTPEDWAGGFVPRFLLVPQIDQNRKLVALPPPADEQKRRRLTAHLELMKRVHGEMVMSVEAKQHYINWYETHVTRRDLPPAFSSTYHRMAVQAIKIAMVLRCMEDPTTVKGQVILTRDIMSAATGEIDFLCRALAGLQRDKLAFTPHEKRRQKIVDLLRHAKDSTSDHSPLLRSSGMDSMEFNRVISTLVDDETLDVQFIREGRKPRKVYRLKQ